jgi:hypothetical protein
MTKRRKMFTERETNYIQKELLNLPIHENGTRYIPDAFAFCEYLRPELHYEVNPKSLYKMANLLNIKISLVAPPVVIVVEEKPTKIDPLHIRVSQLESDVKKQLAINKAAAELHIKLVGKINELIDKTGLTPTVVSPKQHKLKLVVPTHSAIRTF